MNKADRKRIGIISGRFPQSIFHSNINHKLYADKFGYTYINCNFPTKATNPYMNKMYFLKAYIHLFDYLFWIDDDAFFFDFNKDIIQYLPEGDHFFSCCSSPDFKELKTVISSGQFFIKCNETGSQFIDSVLNTNLDVVKNWWQDKHGYFSNGDQDAMVYLMETDDSFKNKVKIHNYKYFNSRVENIIQKIDSHEPLVLHFTGRPEIKWNNYQLVQNRFSLGPSLIGNPDKEGYLYIHEIPKRKLKDKIISKMKNGIKIFLQK